jgi:DNA-directed RNA polymerase
MADAVSLMAEDLNYYFHTRQATNVPNAYRLLLDNEKVSPYIEPEEMVHLALMTMLDHVTDKNIPTYPMSKVFMTIGTRVEDQAKMNYIKAIDPNFFEKLVKYHLKKNNTYSKKIQKVEAEINFRAMDNPEIDWKAWAPEERIAIGSWAAWLIQQSTNWFAEVTMPPRKGDPFGTTKYLVLSREGIKERKKLELIQLDRAYSAYPMLIPPTPWTRGKRGGYILPAPGQIGNLIHGFDVETNPSDKALEFINNLQSQKYRVNLFILDILNTLSKGNHSIGKFKSMGRGKDKVEIDPEIWNLPDTDPVKREHFIEIMRVRATEDKKAAQAISPQAILAVARTMAAYDEPFYQPCFFDTRLRAYPVSHLQSQGTDWHKALLIFDHGGDITSETLEESKRIYEIAIANTWGNKIEKLSFDERVAWAQEHIEKYIDVILENPVSRKSMEIWSKADEPFQHIALLREYKDCIINWKPGTIAHVPIGFDATCSGLQLLGSFVKDPETCRLVNVLPSERPQDAYGAVAEKARNILSDIERWTQLAGREEDTEHGIPIDLIDRSVAKKVVMLTPYGGSYDTLVGHVKEATKDWGISIRDVHTLTKALIQGMAEAVPGFSALNGWFKQAAGLVMDSGAKTITWTTPTGSTIVQSYKISSTKLVKTIAFGVSSYKEHGHYGSTKTLTWDDQAPKEVNKRKNRTALAANWTHSMDAAVLQEAFHDFEHPFTTVHDCLYATAPNMTQALENLRRAFVTVTSYDALTQFLEDNEIDFVLPPIGDADVTSALASEYLFS